MVTTQRKKILFIVNVDWYFRLHWLSRARACQDAGYEVFLACQFSDDTILRQLEAEDIHCCPLELARTSLSPAGEVRSLLQIRRVVRRIQPDLIHTITVKANIYGGLIATANSIPLVSTVAGRGWAFSDGGIKAGLVNRLVNRFYRHVFRHANTRIIFENPDDRDYFVHQRLLNPDQAAVILGAGIDLSHFQLMPADKMRDSCLLFASRMLKSKGLDTLVAACDLLRARGQPVRLRVAGILDESQADALPLAQLEQWAESGNLEWLGQRDDMPKLIGESVLVALPTRYGEGIPRILIEAAACGRTLLATDVSGCREIVRNGHNGVLISPTAEIEEWADALGILLVDIEKSVEMGLNGRRLVEAEFSDTRICRETLELYEDVISD
jgi:glycosyltransferase involved in cell wall biosynthesis